ncbi:hypothetical protein ACFXNW_09185 [Nocardia sp. NPDC059180]|uniref:hypothetical protein n=1 Tax=Nocardia sp. NPDC059180 TaxID=3346761 RepID=UPI0036838973
MNSTNVEVKWRRGHTSRRPIVSAAVLGRVERTATIEKAGADRGTFVGVSG